LLPKPQNPKQVKNDKFIKSYKTINNILIYK